MTASALIGVKESIVDALQIHSIGPSSPLGGHNEDLIQTPARSYLTGFLVPAPPRTQGMTPSEGVASSQLSAKNEAEDKAESNGKSKAKHRKKGEAEGQRGLEFEDG